MQESCLDSCSDSLLIPISQIRIYISHDDTLQAYCMAGKFGSDNVWRKQMDKDLAKKSLVNE